MIVNFSVRNFKSIKDLVTLSFEPVENDTRLEDYYFVSPAPQVKLLKLGLIYGPNGSGKSNILMALDFLRDLVLMPLKQKTEVLALQPFLFDPKTQHEDSSFQLEFYHNGRKYHYEVAVNGKFIRSERLYHYLTQKRSLVYERTTDSEKELTNIHFGPSVKFNKNHKEILEANTLWNNTVLGGFQKTNIESKEIHEVSEWFLDVLKPIVDSGTSLFEFVSRGVENGRINKKNLLTLLSKADFKIQDFHVKENEVSLTGEFGDYINFVNNKRNRSPEDGHKMAPKKTKLKEIWFQHRVKLDNKEQLFELPYNDESQGTQRYYQFSGLLDLIIHEGSVLPVDELESSLHPDLVKHFILAFLVNAEHSQLVATTHFREFLMERDILRHDAIWFTEKKDDGGTDLYCLSDFDSSVIRKDTASIFNAYKSGRLGANPKLKDHYLSQSE